MRWLLITMLAARVAHADCDAEPRTDYSIFIGAQRVVDRPEASSPTPNFMTIGARWELGAEFNCDPTRFRMAFAASVHNENNREEFFPENNPPPVLETRAKLQLGGELEVLVGNDWWAHAGVEKATGDGYEVAVGVRLRSAVSWVGADVVMTTPACHDCFVTPAVGLQVSAGLEGRSATASYVSVGVMAVVAVLGGIGYFLSNCDC